MFSVYLPVISSLCKTHTILTLLDLCSLNRSDLFQWIYDWPGHRWWMKWKAPKGRWWRRWRQRSAAALASAINKQVSDTPLHTHRQVHCNPPVVKQCTVITEQGSVKAGEYIPWEKSVATTTSLCSGLSSAWNEGSLISWPCVLKSGGWSTWQTRVSVGETWTYTSVRDATHLTEFSSPAKSQVGDSVSMFLLCH